MEVEEKPEAGTRSVKDFFKPPRVEKEMRLEMVARLKLLLLTQQVCLVGDFPKTKVCSRFIQINFKTNDDKPLEIAQNKNKKHTLPIPGKAQAKAMPGGFIFTLK